MQVLSSFENLFSVSGYLGNVSYFNANKVFLSAWIFTNGLPDGFSIHNDNGVIYNSKGITFISPCTYIYTNKTYSFGSNILDFYMNPNTNSTDLSGANEYQGYGNVSSLLYSQSVVWSTGGYEGIHPIIANGTKAFLGMLNKDNSGYLLYGVEFNNSSIASFYLNNTFYQTLSMPNISLNPHIIFGIQQNYSVFSPLTVYYAFIRQGNYIMPIFTIVSLYHSIDFKLLGSPFSSLWNIMVNGTTYQADSRIDPA